MIPIHAFGEIEGRLYLEMRLIVGGDLADLLAFEGPLPIDRALSLLGQAAEALDAAHRRQLIHRDVKPSNFLVAPGDFVYLVDFGIAHDLSTAASTILTATGSTIGTLAYMAPERFEDGPVGVAVDVYALACLLYEVLAGRLPFPADSALSFLRAHLSEPPPRVSDVRGDIPKALDDVIARGMAKDPAQRYGSASELIDAARHVVGSAAHRRTLVPSQPPVSSLPQEKPSPAAAGAGVAAAASGSRVSAAWMVAATSLVAVLALIAVLLATGRGFGAVEGESAPEARATGSSAAGGPVVVAPQVVAPQVVSPSAGTQTSTSTTGAPATTESTEADEPGTSSAADGSSSVGDGAVGDLGLSTPISSPACDGAYAVFIGAATVPSSYRQDVARLLDRRPDAAYLLTSQSCTSLARADDGSPVYAVYLGPFGSSSQACSARTAAGGGSYVKRLGDGSPGHASVAC